MVGILRAPSCYKLIEDGHNVRFLSARRAVGLCSIKEHRQKTVVDHATIQDAQTCPSKGF